jgi:hypothetical protein
MNGPELMGLLRRIAGRRPADKHMANAFLRCRDEARSAVREMGEIGDLSDGFHTFNELYEHRCALFIALMRSHPDTAWRSRQHADGSGYDGWWIGGMDLSNGTITYHLPDSEWAELDSAPGLRTLERAPEWDGHTSADVVKRLRHWKP